MNPGRTDGVRPARFPHPMLRYIFIDVILPLLAFLFLRSRSIPVWLAWLGFIGSLLILIGLPLQILALLPAPLDSVMWIPIAFFEVIFAIWLLFREPQIQG